MKAPCRRTFHLSYEFGGLTQAHTSVHSPGTAPGPNGVEPGGIGKSVSAKASSIILVGWGLLPFAWRQAAPLKSPATRSTCSYCITARMAKEKLVPDSSLFGVVADVKRHNREGFLAAGRTDALEMTPCNTHPIILLLSCLVHKASHNPTVCHVEAIRSGNRARCTPCFL